WINLWRDADWIGRAVGASRAARFAETSLGNGLHSDYWGDSRCWSAIVAYLRAVAEGSLNTLASDWASSTISEAEEIELVGRAHLAAVFAVTFNIGIAAGLFYFWMWIRKHGWLSAVPSWNRWVILSMTGIITILVAVYYFLATKRVGGQGVTRRQMLARYRLYWSIAMACLQTAAILSILTAFVLWRSLGS